MAKSVSQSVSLVHPVTKDVVEALTPAQRVRYQAQGYRTQTAPEKSEESTSGGDPKPQGRVK